MASTRIVLGMGLGAAAVALVLACSGSSTGSSSGSAGSSGTSGSAGTSGSSGSSIKNCSTDTTSSKCTQAELQPYSDCITSKCDAPFTQCYGAGWKTGSFSGPCGTYISCTNACACGDTACRKNCTLDMSCTNCLTMASSCTEGCTLPACATASSGGTSGTSGSSGGMHTCADLQACCAKITDTSYKNSCDMTYTAVKANEAQCNAVYPTYASKCP